VQQLQNDLNTVNSGYHLDPDGKFGPDTRIAVLDFQGRNHLGADGTVGATTATELSKQARDQGSVAIPHLQPEPRIGYGIDPAECEAQGPDFKSQPNGWCGWGPHCAKPGDGLVSDGEGHCVPDEAKPLGKSLPDCAREIFGDKAKDAIEKAATDGPEAVAEEFGKKNGVIAGAKAAKCLLLDKPDK
jgi:peptidoglycan hydrolase-like protein with peptidoglycan-binding domain